MSFLAPQTQNGPCAVEGYRAGSEGATCIFSGITFLQERSFDPCSLACVMTKYRLTLNHGVCLLALADQVSVDSFIFAVDVHV